MIVETNIHEVKKRENSLLIIKKIIQSDGRNQLYDLTGLSGGFLLNDEDLKLLETYVGPAIFEDQLLHEGKKHLGGEKILGLNRTSSGILATILALVRPESYVVHYLPKLPSHPSIPRSCELVGANYIEFDNLENFSIPDDTSLIVITGSTMDHHIIDVEEFKEIINKAKSHSKSSDGGVPVLVDDASGARLRTVIFNQPTAIELGADLVVTSTDKLMDGPRGGLMSGSEDLMNEIKSKAHQFGLEAQPPLVAGMVRALESFNPENLLNSLEKKHELNKSLNSKFKGFEETPTGVLISPDVLESQIEEKSIKTHLSSSDISFVWAMILLKSYGILTIPAVGMPGASPTVRFDLAAKDAKILDLDELTDLILNSLDVLLNVVDDPEKCRNIIFN
ncbi:MAG: TIGR03576 family pyridoxal phosphate-dependent enzyme [Methanobacteriaceae archaeon]|nr:TIGR03576 family pyridoxal phosphate-dependent enzyme [Methanobacteriaceae archaeon]MDP2837285.1 TIGR03576 family pyridoxal phosphate-dependent enzyme [Methanobacteriaceae archaeon]MDP3484737.1 TIGR03576 family pyridoxal phosphate-dependent enzyme [Methanobacteriaceae archaeon]MDP3624519.1 TIGR03576 family pyridoxal phosphate-dependent enzyme [Methanobacteriaceae archaeon]